MNDERGEMLKMTLADLNEAADDYWPDDVCELSIEQVQVLRDYIRELERRVACAEKALCIVREAESEPT